LSRAHALAKEHHEKLLFREETIFTTAMLLGCDMRTDECGRKYFIDAGVQYTAGDQRTNGRSQPYTSMVTCADMWLSHIGVYVDPQGVVYLPPYLKR
jgi:hypothetical protein